MPGVTPPLFGESRKLWAQSFSFLSRDMRATQIVHACFFTSAGLQVLSIHVSELSMISIFMVVYSYSKRGRKHGLSLHRMFCQPLYGRFLRKPAALAPRFAPS